MIKVSEYLILLPIEQLLVCRSCKYAVSAKGVQHHFQCVHEAIPLEV